MIRIHFKYNDSNEPNYLSEFESKLESNTAAEVLEIALGPIFPSVDKSSIRVEFESDGPRNLAFISKEEMLDWLEEEVAEYSDAINQNKDNELDELLDVLGCCILLTRFYSIGGLLSAMRSWLAKQDRRGRDNKHMLETLRNLSRFFDQMGGQS
jgi:NTP pyrophosphatase (non-canonical NTP hydrolase)